MDKQVTQLTSQAATHAKKIQKVREEMSKTIVGQEDVIKKVLIALIADGHILLEGVPGLAKTLLIRTLATTIKTSFKRLQFTPDLLPADIIGTKIYEHGSKKFSTQKGPIFHNLILADEINRAPPKVQSALLEAMQERQVTIQGDTFALKPPFLVLATMNPLEHEGVYVLPEAQVDRFMFKIIVRYPSVEEERQVVARNTQGIKFVALPTLSPKDILDVQAFCKKVYADESIEDYIVRIVDATRHPDTYGLKLKDYVEVGASPRASIWLMMGAKAHAIMEGRGFVKPEDVQAIAADVLRHRILLTYGAEAEGMKTDDVIAQILETVQVP